MTDFQDAPQKAGAEPPDSDVIAPGTDLPEGSRASASLPSSTGDFLRRHIADASTQWSIGTFGAIAEFLRDTDEAVDHTPFSAVTPRGGIGLTPRADMFVFAFETTTRDSWSPRVALCLPEAEATMAQRTVLTELGPDRDALRPQDRGGILFDVGIGALQLDLCVRIDDPELAALLRAECGKPTFSHESKAGGLIITHSPHRVFISKLGRAEVYQSIPPAHGTSPEGPHTHVLFDLLRHRRTHAATEPIPAGLVPCGHIYPAHPVKDARGYKQPYVATRHVAFEETLQQFGDPRFVRLKADVIAALAAGDGPESIRAQGRFARTVVRVTLRQQMAAGAPYARLADWVAAFDVSSARDTDEDRHIHHR